MFPKIIDTYGPLPVHKHQCSVCRGAYGTGNPNIRRAGNGSRGTPCQETDNHSLGPCFFCTKMYAMIDTENQPFIDASLTDFVRKHGIYTLYGMSQRRVARLMQTENIFILPQALKGVTT